MEDFVREQVRLGGFMINASEILSCLVVDSAPLEQGVLGYPIACEVTQLVVSIVIVKPVPDPDEHLALSFFEVLSDMFRCDMELIGLAKPDKDFERRIAAVFVR